MYDVMVYDEDIGQFVPMKVGGKRQSYKSWAEASDAAWVFTLRNPARSYKVEYRTARRKVKR